MANMPTPEAPRSPLRRRLIIGGLAAGGLAAAGGITAVVVGRGSNPDQARATQVPATSSPKTETLPPAATAPATKSPEPTPTKTPELRPTKHLFLQEHLDQHRQ